MRHLSIAMATNRGMASSRICGAPDSEPAYAMAAVPTSSILAGHHYGMPICPACLDVERRANDD